MKSYTRDDIQRAGGWTYDQFRLRRRLGIIPPPDGPRCCPVYTRRHYERAREAREIESAALSLAAVARQFRPRARTIRLAP